MTDKTRSSDKLGHYVNSRLAHAESCSVCYEPVKGLVEKLQAKYPSTFSPRPIRPIIGSDGASALDQFCDEDYEMSEREQRELHSDSLNAAREALRCLTPGETVVVRKVLEHAVDCRDCYSNIELLVDKKFNDYMLSRLQETLKKWRKGELK